MALESERLPKHLRMALTKAPGEASARKGASGPRGDGDSLPSSDLLQLLQRRGVEPTKEMVDRARAAEAATASPVEPAAPKLCAAFWKEGQAL